MKEGGREKERKGWREKVGTSGHMWRSLNRHLTLLALPFSAQHSKKWWLHQLPQILSNTQLWERFYCNHWTPFPESFGKSSVMAKKKHSWLEHFDLLSFLVEFSLPSPGHNFWGLCVELRKCQLIVLISLFVTMLQLASCQHHWLIISYDFILGVLEGPVNTFWGIYMKVTVNQAWTLMN